MNISYSLDIYLAAHRDMINNIGTVGGDTIFILIPLFVLGLVPVTLGNDYLDNAYPNWRDELEKIPNEFYKKMRELMKQENITKYIDAIYPKNETQTLKTDFF